MITEEYCNIKPSRFVEDIIYKSSKENGISPPARKNTLITCRLSASTVVLVRYI